MLLKVNSDLDEQEVAKGAGRLQPRDIILQMEDAVAPL
jgi:hypothetical protein